MANGYEWLLVVISMYFYWIYMNFNGDLLVPYRCC
jgi:hypothetical protein